MWLRCASTHRSRLALLGAARRCGCATLLHSYTLALGPVDPVSIVTIGWLLPECQSGLWSVLSDASVLFMGFTSAAIKFGSVSTDTSILCTDSHWGCSGSSPIPGNHPHSARAGRCHSITIYTVAIYTIKSPIYFITCFHHPSNK